MIWKIENDNLYRTTYLSRDHNNDSLAEIIEGIEIENGKIILQNILGDIYILDKNEKYKEKEIKKFCDNYYIDYEDEYKFMGYFGRISMKNFIPPKPFFFLIFISILISTYHNSNFLFSLSSNLPLIFIFLSFLFPFLLYFPFILNNLFFSKL